MKADLTTKTFESIKATLCAKVQSSGCVWFHISYLLKVNHVQSVRLLTGVLLFDDMKE